MIPIIDYNKCISCEACVDICDNSIFESHIFGGIIVVKVDSAGYCVQCCECQSYCEQDAIEFE